MNREDRTLILEAIDINRTLIVIAIEQNTDKLKELLERVEYIDNTLDEWDSDKDISELLEGVKALVQQGRP